MKKYETVTHRNLIPSIIDALTYEVMRFNAHIEKFQRQFAADPAFALDCSDDVFYGVARRDVCQSAIKRLNAAGDGVSAQAAVASLRAYAESLAFSQACTANSTSQTANLLARAKGAAWVELIDTLDAFVNAADMAEALGIWMRSVSPPSEPLR